jgi:hypothetical protein
LYSHIAIGGGNKRKQDYACNQELERPHFTALRLT